LVFCQRPDSANRPVWTTPLTTPLLAQVLERAGWDVSLVDSRFMRAAHGSDEALADETARAILDTSPDVVGFSFLSVAATLAERVATAVRRERPSLPLMAGGTHCTVAPEHYTEPYDVIVRGEGEGVIAKIADQLAAGRRPARAERVVRAPEADLARAAPVVGADWPLYEAEHRRGHPHRTAYLQLGRGCAFPCAFCEIAVKSNYSAARRARPPLVVCAEAERWRSRHDATFFIVVDSIATTAPQFVETFAALGEVLDGCAIMLNSAMPVFRDAQARAIGRWPGPVTVWFGLETASETLGRRILGSKWQPAAIDRSLSLCRQDGIDVGLNCIFGFADETQADRECTIELLDRARVAFPNPNIYTPLPGTPLYDEYRERGLLRDPDDFSPWPAERIEREGVGPVLGVDYDAVVTAYRGAAELRGKQQRTAERERWPEWK
jgi:bacteriochlorophyll C8 methyltransferase